MGTVYCLHHDEEELVGSDPVPCPFCGYGAEAEEDQARDQIEALGIEDSSTALHHALTTAEPSGPRRAGNRLNNMRAYW